MPSRCLRRLIVVVAFQSLFLVGPVAFGQGLPTAPSPAKDTALRPGQIDVRRSRVFARVDKTGLGHEHAIEGRVKEGEIRLGAAQDAGTILFDMRSFRADTTLARKYIGLEGETSASTQQQVNANMLGEAVLNARKYPTATFAVASALPLDKKSRRGNSLYRLKGEFTLHGTTRPLQVNAEIVETKDRTRVRGGFRIKQTDYGITPYSKAFGAIGVADQMTIYGEFYTGRIPTTAQNRKPSQR